MIRNETSGDARSRARPGAGLDVLLVDDEEDARAVLHLAMAKLGHRCRVARDGEEALRLVAERRPDVVISDWEMPGMTGAEVCHRVRETDNGRYTYFILVSAWHDRAHLLAGMAAGADDYQKKPVDLDELEARLVSATRVVALHRQLAEREEHLRADSSYFWNASRTDALTGIGNRLRMDEELAAAWAHAVRYGHRFSAALVDVDHFKQYNDGLGHLAGDEALKNVARALRRVLRTGDAVFRYGGEEFLVLLPEQSLADAVRALERVRAEVAASGILRPRSNRPLTVSTGVAELDLRFDRSVSDWVARADAALFRAKKAGRNRVESLRADANAAATAQGNAKARPPRSKRPARASTGAAVRAQPPRRLAPARSRRTSSRS